MPNAPQSQIFDIISPMMQCAIDGHNICIFAHGQTGKLLLYHTSVFLLFSLRRKQLHKIKMSLNLQDRAKHLR